MTSAHISARRFVRNELNAEEQREAAKHLDHCARCRAAVATEARRLDRDSSEPSASEKPSRKTRRLPGVMLALLRANQPS